MMEVVPLVEENSLQVSDAGYDVKLRLKWYRSLPVSCIERLLLSLDGQPVDPERVRVSLNSHEYRLEELPELVEEFWFVQDPLVVRVDNPAGVAPGEPHKIDLELAMRFPYIPIGPGRFLTHVHKYSAEQVAH